MADLEKRTLARSWIFLAGVLTVFELIFLCEAILADLSELQRVFSVFLGLAVVCLAGLLYTLKVVFYD
jgi:cytochrome c biogenesis protein CcdA